MALSRRGGCPLQPYGCRRHPFFQFSSSGEFCSSKFAKHPYWLQKLLKCCVSELYGYMWSVYTLRETSLKSGRISVQRTVIGTGLELLITFLAAYPLSKGNSVFKGRTRYVRGRARARASYSAYAELVNQMYYVQQMDPVFHYISDLLHFVQHTTAKTPVYR